MRDYTNIIVVAAAIHIVAPREGRLTLTHALLDIDEGVADFLAHHVQRGLGDAKAAAADFIGSAPNHAGPIARAALDGSRDLLAASRELAKKLYEATEEDERVSDGTLAVLSCTGDEDKPFIALLKLDPSDQFSAVIDQDDAGNDMVRLEVRSDVLPSVRERVQKSAFIQPIGGEYDMLLVDRQRRGTTVSKFFIRDFLLAELTFDARARTEELVRTLYHTENEVAVHLDADQARRLHRYLDGQVMGTSVNTNNLVDGLPVPEDLKVPFRRRLDEHLPDREFDIDDDTVRRLQRRYTFRGDNDLAVSARADAWDDMVDASYLEGEGIWEITLRTREWIRR